MPSKPISHPQQFSSSSSSSSLVSSSSSSSRSRIVWNRKCIDVRAHLHVHARFSMAFNDPPRVVVLICMMISCMALTSFGASDTDILLKFKESLANDEGISNWNHSIIPCTGEKANWIGIICTNSRVWGIQLENMGLTGIIDVDTLMGLSSLRTLSFMNNNFDGPLPNFKNLAAMKTLYLSNNKFSGEIPDDAFDGMVWLKKVFLANNQFSGKIPSSLAALVKLLDLRLDGNQFEGEIPNFNQKDLRMVNVTNNKLDGPIPARLSKMDKSSFAGNSDLCGPPLDTVCPPSHFPYHRKKHPHIAVIIAIIAIIVGLLLAIMCAVFIMRRRRKSPELGRDPSLDKGRKTATTHEGQKIDMSSPAHSGGGGRKSDNAKLVFIRDDTVRFDLQDLLRASAEVLGSGTFGSSYKAALLTGPTVVVKRFRQMNNVGREDFQEHMRRLGRLRHQNLLALSAYYYRKEEKLLVSEFVENGCLAYHLHGNRSADTPGLDWPTRLKIIKGVAKGLSYLHSELPSVTLPHGHLKSSNVLLNESFEPLLTDYGLVPVINKDHAIQLMIAYRSPEYTQNGRVTKKTDVWSLGILILEMLTGKFPENYLTQGKGGSNADLAKWVNSVVREEWTGEVFDNEMKGTKNGEGELLKLLKIGLGCCEAEVETRWELKEAVEKIEELKERDNDDDYYSSFASEGDMHSRAHTEDDFSFSMNG